MIRRARRLMGATILGALLVGCSWFGSHASGGGSQASGASKMLRPGLGPVVVEPGRPQTARISWYSPWQGQSVIRVSRQASLEQPILTSPTDAQRTTLKNLDSGVRYYFRVETRTDMGMAHSSVCSFVAK
ncbi:MAG: hypothetical protein VKP62_01525 [Candidatus Sericytochromatia bacterium]|nr:hypothetical protein [Candidatus Sericytochromatia bacterium]